VLGIWQIIWQTTRVRTTLDLDEDLLEALRARHPELSKTDAIELAVRNYLATEAETRLRLLAGTLDIADISIESRRADRRA
jgi:hypothetical protein